MDIRDELAELMAKLIPRSDEDWTEPREKYELYEGKDVIGMHLITIVEDQMNKYKAVFDGRYPIDQIISFSRKVVLNFMLEINFNALPSKQQMFAMSALIVTALRFGAASGFSVKPFETYLITPQKLGKWIEEYAADPDAVSIEVGPDTVHSITGLSFKALRDCHDNNATFQECADVITYYFSEAFIMGAAAREMINIWNDPELSAAMDRQQEDMRRTGGVQTLIDKLGLGNPKPAQESTDDHGLADLFEETDFFLK